MSLSSSFSLQSSSSSEESAGRALRFFLCADVASDFFLLSFLLYVCSGLFLVMASLSLLRSFSSRIASTRAVTRALIASVSAGWLLMGCNCLFLSLEI